MSEQETPVVDAAAAGGGRDLAEQLAERTEDLQRVTAEYANYRKRVDRDRSLVVDQAAERFAPQLLPMLDDIERAREHGDLTGAFKVGRRAAARSARRAGLEAFGDGGRPVRPVAARGGHARHVVGGERPDRDHGAAAGLPPRRPRPAARDGGGDGPGAPGGGLAGGRPRTTTRRAGVTDVDDRREGDAR